jgi:uncharacterized heparinase superfamily protein
MPLTRLPLLLRTLPYLTGTQMAYQFWYRLRAKLPVDSRTPACPPPESIEAQALTPRAPFLQRPFIRQSDIERHSFTFLNQSETFHDAIDWGVPHKGRLWRYNLHYFDYLFPDRPLSWISGQRLMADWIRSNPVGTPDAWDPFPTSLRVVNWIKFLAAHQGQRADDSEVCASLYGQVLFIERHLEFHLLANHLFKNIKALLFAGLYFRGDDAERWRNRGLRLLAQQLSEQVLPDGGHFERSPMYHAMVLEDVLDLLNIMPENEGIFHELRSKLMNTAEVMAGVLQALTHPDGDMALFNDAAFGIEHTAHTLAGYYAAVTGQSAPTKTKGPITAFPDTGYFIMTPAAGNKLIIDCGAIGPDYQPGHAHCDILSFELSIQGRRVIVDSGCCQYEDGPIRQYNRGNAGHNTVTIDGQNQSEVWSAHRCARRAYPLSAELYEAPDGSLCFQGAHDGYQRLPGKPVHLRRVLWKKDVITITDRVEGADLHALFSTLHIHPDLKVTAQADGVLVSGPEGPLARILARGETHIDTQKGWYCPEFNRQIACPKLNLTIKAALPVEFGWEIQVL